MRLSAILPVVTLAASFGWAQTTTTPGQPAPSGSTTPQAQSSPQTPPSGATPAAGNHKVLQAKSQEELKAYQDAYAKTDPSQVEAAADDFAAKYPNSELRASIYIRAMNLYSQQNNAEKVIVTGEKAIADDPTNPIPLVQVASALAETTHETDLDREQRLAQAAKYAHAAIDNVDTGLIIPANADPARVATAKNNILTMSYDTLGMVDMDKKDYPSAEQNLHKAIELGKDHPEAVLYLRLSVAQDNMKQYQQALDSANKAVQYSQEGTVAQNLAKQQQARLQKLMAAGSPETGAPAASAPSPSPSGPPGMQPGQSPIPTSPTMPH